MKGTLTKSRKPCVILRKMFVSLLTAENWPITFLSFFVHQSACLLASSSIHSSTNNRAYSLLRHRLNLARWLVNIQNSQLLDFIGKPTGGRHLGARIGNGGQRRIRRRFVADRRDTTNDRPQSSIFVLNGFFYFRACYRANILAIWSFFRHFLRFSNEIFQISDGCSTNWS